MSWNLHGYFLRVAISMLILKYKAVVINLSTGAHRKQMKGFFETVHSMSSSGILTH